MRSQKIEKIRSHFRREWLLIAVDKMDERTTTPLTGRLIAHSRNKDEIYKKETKRRGNTLTIYSDEGLPEGYAAAFSFHV